MYLPPTLHVKLQNRAPDQHGRLQWQRVVDLKGLINSRGFKLRACFVRHELHLYRFIVFYVLYLLLICIFMYYSV